MITELQWQSKLDRIHELNVLVEYYKRRSKK